MKFSSGAIESNFTPSKSKLIEIMCHPGYITGVNGGCGSGPDEFSQSIDREWELEQFTSTELKFLLQSYSVHFERYLAPKC